MEQELKAAYQFDFVYDGQSVFRQILHAMANPGKKGSIAEEASRFGGEYGALLAIGCTLLDNEEIMYVEKNPRLSQELHSLTLSRPGSLTDADYVFLSSEMNYGTLEQILKKVKKGTYVDPQQSATILFSCRQIDGSGEMTLEGPGIDGKIHISVNPYIKKIIEIRQTMETEYPLGTDLIFADLQGNLLCVPRLCRIA